MLVEIKRGEIYLADLGEGKGSVQGKRRPVIIWSNNLNNRYSPTVNVIPISGQIQKVMPMHVLIDISCGLDEVSMAMPEQIQTINKPQLIHKIGQCDAATMEKLKRGVEIQQDMREPFNLSYINERLYLIKETESRINSFTNNEYFVKMKETLDKELKTYCSKYDIDYSNVINKNMIIDVKFTRTGVHVVA